MRFAVDERDVGGGASHVEGDDLAEATEARGGGGSDDSAGRAGEHGAHRFAGCGGERGDASAGLHDENTIAARRLREALVEALEVALHYRLKVSIHDDGTGAFVLAEFGEDFVRDGERQVE